MDRKVPGGKNRMCVNRCNPCERFRLDAGGRDSIDPIFTSVLRQVYFKQPRLPVRTPAVAAVPY